MDELRRCHEPGILLVVSRPSCEDYAREFNDWYDTEHGPARLRLGDEYFLNGYRYRSMDDGDLWLAIYDMNKLSMGASPEYNALRQNRSRREQIVFQQALTVLSRQFYRLESVWRYSNRPAAAVTCIWFRVRRPCVEQVRPWFSTNVLAKFQQHVDCVRWRVFCLVEGVGLRDDSVSILSVLDWRGTRIDSAFCLAIANLLARSKDIGLQCTALQTFSFHRAFSADDYIAPPEDFELQSIKKHDVDSSKA